MNPGALVIFLAGLVGIFSAIPLIQGRVKMNPWYGIRIPEAFTSEKNWLEINAYGGRQLLSFGFVIVVVALAELFVPRRYWPIANLVALAVIVFWLILAVRRLYVFAKHYEKPPKGQPPMT